MFWNKKDKDVELLITCTFKYSFDIFRGDVYVSSTPEMEARVKAITQERARNKLRSVLQKEYRVCPIIKFVKEEK